MRPTTAEAPLRAERPSFGKLDKYQLSQMQPRDVLPHAHRAVHRDRWTLSVTNWPTSSVERQLMGLSQLRYEHDSSTIRLRFDYDSATTRYNTLRDRIRESVVGVSCMLIDSSMHTAFTVYLYRPTLHRVCEHARNCVYKGN